MVLTSPLSKCVNFLGLSGILNMAPPHHFPEVIGGWGATRWGFFFIIIRNVNPLLEKVAGDGPEQDLAILSLKSLCLKTVF